MRPLQCIVINHRSNLTITSPAIDARNLLNFSLQACAGTGSCAGTIQVQFTNDLCEVAFSQFVPVNWTNLGSALTFAQGSTASNQGIVKTDISHTAIRIVFTDSSSGSNTSTLVVNLHGQGI